MLEKLSKKLVPYGRTHAWLRWPILGLLMLVWGLDCAWAFTQRVGKEIWEVIREAGAHLRESGLTPQGIHDNAERLLDAGIAAAKKLPTLWTRVRQELLPLVYTKGREAFTASRQWFAVRLPAAKAALLTCGKGVKTHAHTVGQAGLGKLRRMAGTVRADLPEYKRHAPRRAMAATLALVMCLGMLPVSAFAAEADCTHVHDAACYRQELTCGKEESEGHAHGEDCSAEPQTCALPEHTHGDACMTDGVLTCTQEEHTHDAACVESGLTCDKVETQAHTHGADCYTEVLDCQHVHDETCGGLEEVAPQCSCGATPDADGNTVHGSDCPLYVAPAEPEIPAEPTAPECSCGAAPDADGNTIHAEGCPLYTAPVVVCATCGEAHETADCPVEAVRALIAALPTPEAISAMTEEQREERGAYEAMEAAYNAYDALTDAQKALLPDAMDTFTALQAALGAPMLMTAETVIPLSTAEDLVAVEKVLRRTAGDVVIGGETYTIGQYGANTIFELTNDIDLTGVKWRPFGMYIGLNSNVGFKGTFDGKGHSILNMDTQPDYTDVYDSEIRWEDRLGLFSWIDYTGVVKNLTVTGSVSGQSYLGGIAGQNSGLIENCVSRVNVTATGSLAGGIAGMNTIGAVENDSSGRTYTPTIRRCANYGTVTAGSLHVGGIVGWDEGTYLQECFNAGDISGKGEVGGIAGRIEPSFYVYINPSSNVSPGGPAKVFSDCYNTGNIKAGTMAGGIVGSLLTGVNVKNFYSAGKVVECGAGDIGSFSGYIEARDLSSCVGLDALIVGAPKEMWRELGAMGRIGVIRTGDPLWPSQAILERLYAREDMQLNGETVTGGATDNPNGRDIKLGTPFSDTVFDSWSRGVWTLPAGNMVVGGPLPTLKNVAQSTEQTPTLPAVPVGFVTFYNGTIPYRSGTPQAPQIVWETGPISEPAPPTKDHSFFRGWTTDPEGTNLFDFSTPITGNLKLYAKWEKESCTVSFDLNYPGAGTPPAPIRVEYGSGYAPLPTATRPSYNLEGWYLEPECTTRITGYKLCTTTEDHTLYAAWVVGAFAVAPVDYVAVYNAASHTIGVTVPTDIAGATFTYQWYQGKGSGMTLIPGATNATYPVKVVADSGYYTCKVTRTADGKTDTAQTTVTCAITRKESAVVWKTNESYTYKPYDQSSTVTATCAGANGTDVTLTVAFEGRGYTTGPDYAIFKKAGDYTATASMKTDAENYVLTNTTIPLTIAPAPRTIPAPKVTRISYTEISVYDDDGVQPSAGSDIVEYAINTKNEVPYLYNDALWKPWDRSIGVSFDGLTPGTTYYLFARAYKSSDYQVAVSEGTAFTTKVKSLTKIAITTQPTSKNYMAYDTLEVRGMVVTATYSDGSTEVITDYTVVYPDNRDSFRTGNMWVRLTYGDQMCTLDGLTVTAATVPVPTIQSKTYTGEVLTADVAEDARYTIQNDGGINAGKYSVVLTLVDTRDCQWSDSTIAPKTLNFSISKSGNPWITQPSCADIVFGETPNPIAKPTFGAETMTVTYALKGTWTEYPKPDKVGEWTAVFRMPETVNYSSRYVTVDFTVSPKPYSETEFSIAPIPIPDQTYTGNYISPELVVKCGETELVKGDFRSGDYYTAYLDNKNVGTAKISIYFRGNYDGIATTTFQIVNAKLPEGTTNDSIFRLPATELMTWHNKDFYLNTMNNWQVLNSYGNYGTYVTLSTESTRDESGNIVPSSMDLIVKNTKTNKIYETTVTYLLDKTAPVITVDGMGEDGVNKIWDDEKTVTIHITDALSGVRYVNIVGQDASTLIEYGDPDSGYQPLPADGVYTYTVKANDIYSITAYDNADNQPFWGNGELPTFVVEKIDREKPTAAFDTITGTPGADGWFTGDITVNVNIDDPETVPDDESTVAINESNMSGIKVWEYSLDGGKNWNTGSESSFTIDTDGDYTDMLRLRATDNAGNVSEIATASVKLDKTAPVVSLSMTAGGAAYDGAAFTAHDVVITPSNTASNLSGVTYHYKYTKADAETETTGASLTVDWNCDTTITVWAVSGAGVKSAEVTVTVKRSAMSAEELAETEYGEGDFSVSPDKSGDWYTELPAVTVTPKDTVGEDGLDATTYYELYKAPAESGSKTELTDPYTIKPTEDGIWTLKIWTEDEAGNKTNPHIIILQVDTTAPTITDVAGNPTDWVHEDADITFTVADATSGVKSVVVTCSDGMDVTYTDGGFTADRNGTYTITVTDHAGNTHTETVVVDKIDKATLATPTVTGYTSDTWVSGDITFALATTDTTTNVPSGTKFQVKVGDADWAVIETPYAVTQNTDGVVYQFRTVSGAGAVSEAVELVVKLDQTTPVITAEATAGGASYTGAATAHNVVITLSNTAANISGTTYYYQKTGDADWTKLDGNVLTVDFNCDTIFTFKAISGADIESGTQTVAVKRSAMSAEELAKTEYGEGDFSVSPDKSGDWYTELPTVTVTPKDTVGVDGLPATTYYELYKSPAESGTKTQLTDPWTISPAEDGIWTLKIWTEDAAGNKTNPYTIILQVDTTDPTISEPAGNPTQWQSADAAITFTAADATSGVKSVVVTCDDGAGVTFTDGGFTADRNGTYTITVTDKAGNISTKKVVVTKIDKHIPKAPTVTGYTSDTWVSSSISFALSTTDTTATIPSGVSFQVKVGGGEWAATEVAYPVTENTNGVAYQFRVISGTGVPSETVDFIVKLDQTIPVITTDVTAGGTAYDGQSFTAHDVVVTLGNSADNISGTTYYYQKTGDAQWTELDGSVLTVDFNCTTTFTFKAVSGAALESSNQPTAQVKRSAMSEEELAQTEYGESDFTVSPDKSGDWYTEIPTVTVTPKDTVGVDGLPATTYYELYKSPAESGSKTKLSAPYTITPNEDGIWTLKVWTEDAAGNQTKPYIITLMVDTTPPTITDVTGNATSWQKTDVTLTVNGAADATSGLADQAYSFDGGATWQAASTKIFAANTTVTIWVRDKAGNTYKHAPITIDKIDKTAPVVTWDGAASALDANKWYGKTALTATATDDSGEAPAITLTSGGKTYANGATIDKNGTYSVTAIAKDGAGNVGRSTVLTLRIETAIDVFVDMVNGLDGNSDYKDILDAKTWYDNQSTTIRDHFSKSDAAQEAYEKLLGLLRDKAEEAAAGVTDAIQNADTVEEIKQAAKDYDALPDEAKDKVPEEVKKELEQKKKDADAAQKVIDQLANADRPKTDKDPGGSYEEKQSAQEAYKNLTDSQKELVNKEVGAVEDKGHIDADLAAIDGVLDLLKDIKKPYTPATKAQITAAENAYNGLTDKQKDAFPKSDKAKLDALVVMRDHAQAVEDKISALGDSPSQAELNTAKGAYNALTADEKAMVDGTLKTELDQKYQDMLDQLGADDKAAAEFAAKVEEVKNAPTVEKIEQLIKDHDALSDAAKDKLSDKTQQDYQDLVDTLNKVKDVIDKLDDIDTGKLTPDDLDEIKDVLDQYDDLDEAEQKLVDNATNGKPGILDEAVKGVEDATDKIEAIPDHTGGSTKPDGSPNLGDCDNTGNAGSGNTGSGGHTYEDHKTAIEEAKIAYEKLTDAGRKLISDEAKEKLNREYAALMAYLEYQNTAKTTSTKVEVAGLAEKVELPPESAAAGKTVVAVVMKDEKPAVMPPLPAGKSEALSVDIKLVASIYNDAADTAPAATETVQPESGKKVLVKLLLPTGYKLDTLEIWHVKDSGGRSRIQDFWQVTESDGTYAVFEVSSFSHFVFFAEKTPTGGTGDGTVTPTPKPDVPSTDHGSTTINPQQPRPGTTVTISPKPNDGYVVDKVIVTDQSGKELPVKDNGDGTYSYTQPNGKVTVTVTFKPAAKDNEFPFTDVTERDWFYESVKYVYEKGLMVGTSDTIFSPNLSTSRGMIITILWRLEGEPGAKAAAPFADVAADKYYAAAVAWGAENGIVKGYGNGNYGPNDLITREQLAAILYRYAQCKGRDTSATNNLTQFSDQPSAWAAEAMRWAVGAGILSGKGGGILDPLGKATRAEAATMLMRFLEK